MREQKSKKATSVNIDELKKIMQYVHKSEEGKSLRNNIS